MSKRWYNNGIKQVFREERPDGFIFDGMLNSSKAKMSKSKKGKPAWNKGLTKEIDARVNQISQTQKNRYISEEHRKNISEGTKKAMARPEVKEKLAKAHLDKKIPEDVLRVKLSKEYITKKKNNSFNNSKPEEELYKKLQNEYTTKHIYRNYKCERYPFYCDFYILEDDLFIELNAHWTHGGKPYDPNDPECAEKLNIWKEKSKQSKFYENAIKTWTERDVEKQRVAKENNLNYQVIY